MKTYVGHGFNRAEEYVGSGFSRIALTTRPGVRTTVLALAALLAAVLAAGASAQDLPRLPGPIKLTRTGDSPGQVVFAHGSHVDPAKPACTACHPREFRILRASPRRAPVRHAEMDTGRYCGACHDGKKAFALDECAACHQD